MRANEFLLLAVVVAVLQIGSPSLIYVVVAHVLAVCGAWASYREWARHNPEEATA